MSDNKTEREREREDEYVYRVSYGKEFRRGLAIDFFEPPPG